MRNFSTYDVITGALLLLIFSYVSYRIVMAMQRSRSVGLFNTVGNIPILHLVFSIVALPFLLGGKFINLRRNSPRRKKLLDTASIIGNRSTHVFHYRGCEYAEVMSYSKRIAFLSIAEAKSKGFKPCATCKPILDNE